MIGVVCDAHQRRAYEELFELFKTPWGFAEDRNAFRALLVSGPPEARRAPIMVVFGREPTPFDERLGIEIGSSIADGVVESDVGQIVIARGLARVGGPGRSCLRIAGTGETVGIEIEAADGLVLRLGYDLADEIDALLGSGQDRAFAAAPTLELHIDLLRRFLVRSLGHVVEIPPIKAGRPFGVCLTHDIDFHSIRSHRFDRTLLGFIWRASVGSTRDALTGRGSFRRLGRNLKALASLPLVFAGLLPDVWSPFEDYERADGDRSTFFVIPFRDTGGGGLSPERSRRRAVKYDVDDVESTLRRLSEAGYEIAVHGIDAWRDAKVGRQELQRVAAVTGRADLGVRMHWLCNDDGTPATVERAGFVYDATAGYNDAVGYKGGTTQVYRPAGADSLLELPLHVQDTALFFPGRLHLRDDSAWSTVAAIIENARRFGGVITVSWHDRSLAPERLWDTFYARLLAAVRAEQAWFGTAREVVDWFRLRRAVTFTNVERIGDSLQIGLVGPGMREVADQGLVVRVHSWHDAAMKTEDVFWDGSATLTHVLVESVRTEPEWP